MRGALPENTWGEFESYAECYCGFIPVSIHIRKYSLSIGQTQESPIMSLSAVVDMSSLVSQVCNSTSAACYVPQINISMSRNWQGQPFVRWRVLLRFIWRNRCQFCMALRHASAPACRKFCGPLARGRSGLAGQNSEFNHRVWERWIHFFKSIL